MTLKRRRAEVSWQLVSRLERHDNQESVVLTKAWTQINETGQRAHTSAAHQSLTKGQRQFDIEKVFSRNSAVAIGSPHFKNISLDTGLKPFAKSSSIEAIELKRKMKTQPLNEEKYLRTQKRENTLIKVTSGIGFVEAASGITEISPSKEPVGQLPITVNKYLRNVRQERSVLPNSFSPVWQGGCEGAEKLTSSRPARRRKMEEGGGRKEDVCTSQSPADEDRCCPHSGQALPLWCILSGDSLTDTDNALLISQVLHNESKWTTRINHYKDVHTCLLKSKTASLRRAALRQAVGWKKTFI